MDYGTFVSFLTDKTTVIVSNKDDFENFVNNINVDKDVFIALLKDFVAFVEEQVGSESCIVVEPRVDKINEDSHVARLWANEKVSKLANSRNGKDKIKAVEIASDYHLVTPVSGAVVLENTEQYIEAGLEPVSEETSPQVIPEPGIMLIIGLLATCCIMRRRTSA